MWEAKLKRVLLMNCERSSDERKGGHISGVKKQKECIIDGILRYIFMEWAMLLSQSCGFGDEGEIAWVVHVCCVCLRDI